MNLILNPLKSPFTKVTLMNIFLVLSLSSEVRSQTVGGRDYSDRSDVDNTFDMAGEDIFGQRFPAEHFTMKDEVTGTEIIALTTSRHNSSKIYQTHPQWTPDGKYIIFRSNRASDGRGGHAYAVSMEDYEIVQVTTGEGGSNLHLGWKTNVAYYFNQNKLIELNLGALLADSENNEVKDPEDYEQVIATLPEGIRATGGFGLDAGEERGFFAARLEEDLSGIYSIDFISGEITKLKEVPFRANHLQANPWVSGEIMYCWETGGDAPQRMWFLTIDEAGNVENRPLYEETPEEWVTHELFIDPDHILFNVMGHLDRLREKPTGIFLLNIRNHEVTKYPNLGEGGYWHADGTSDLKWAVGDTFNGKLYRLNLEDENDVELLTTGHRPNSKGPFTSEAHSHHSISPDGKWVLFNSSMLINSDIMLVPLHTAENN